MGKATKSPVSQNPTIPVPQHPSTNINTPKPTETITITRQQ